MKRLAALCVLVPTLAIACINDRDTLAFELRNVDAIRRIHGETNPARKVAAIQELALKAIGGRFERFPPRYYQMRIDRLEKQSALSAADWDDLAVAYDRLGKIDKAIALILESRSHRATPNDQYRFHANYGTFLVHRWIASGHTKADLKTLEESIGEIEAAVKINPKSHFGRENVQVALEKSWLATARSQDASRIWGELKDEDAIVGLAGIAMMGLGYELPDLYAEISGRYLFPAAEESILGVLAAHRYKDLVAMGKAPIFKAENGHLWTSAETLKDYNRLRADGEKVHQARLAYMNERFDKGLHPDTDPSFWAEWKEPPMPVLKREPNTIGQVQRYGPLVLVGVAALAIFALGTLLAVKWAVRKSG